MFWATRLVCNKPYQIRFVLVLLFVVVISRLGYFRDSSWSGTVVAEYLGKVCLANPNGKSEFVIIFPNSFAEEQTELVRIDANECGNESRFANHDANLNNCEFNWRWIKGKLRVLIVAISDIQPNQEILVNYGTGFFKS